MGFNIEAFQAIVACFHCTPHDIADREAAFRVGASACILSENDLIPGQYQGVTMLNQNGKVSSRPRNSPNASLRPVISMSPD